MKKIIAGIVAAALACQVAFVAACAKDIPDGEDNTDVGEETQEVMPDFEYSTYDNTRFSDYSADGAIKCDSLPDQWSEYGAGDPYIFRFNGMYYLYVSTRDLMTGVRGWKSADLLNWQKCTGEGLEEGYVSNDGCTRTAYAPEVYYFNGKFYMYTSPAGNGHYILTSDSPEGPFVRVSENFGMSIDGSVFVDDDESMYFLNASVEGIEIHPMASLQSVPGKATVLSNTKLGWTEGPMIIKRNGIYYLTYTGVHVLSPGYRISYSTQTDGSLLLSDTAFKGGADNPVLLDIDGDYNGLGHSSTVLGPDMDSYYIVYHSLHEITDHGPWRSMNIDRLVFNGTQMSVDGSAKGSVAANLPAFSADGTGKGFDSSGDMKISQSKTGKVFTAEYNFTGDNVKCIAGYTDEKHYAYVTADYENHTITLHTVAGGTDRVAGEGTLVHDFDPQALHTVRIAYADGVADVYFDNMCKINSVKINVEAGKIGYEGGTVYHTAFSNVARGYSDRIELKQSGTKIGSCTYLPEGAYEGLTSYKLTGSSGLSVYESELEKDSCYDGAYSLMLAEAGDFVRYSAYFREDGTYGLALTYDAKYGGRQIGVQINLGEVKRVTLPAVGPDDADIVTAVIGRFEFNKGVNLVSLHAMSRDVEFISFTFGKIATGEVKEALTSQAESADYLENYGISSAGHATVANQRNAAFFGNRNYADGEISVDIKLSRFNGQSAGIMLRARNYANTRYDDARSLQGYYVGLYKNKVTLHKYNYNYSEELVSVSHNVKEGGTVNLKAVISGNTVTVYLDGEEACYFTDANAIISGGFGLLSDGAEAVYSNLYIKAV